MNRCLFLLAVLALQVHVSAQRPNVRVRFTSIVPGPGVGQVSVSLASGVTIAIPERDLFRITSVASFSVRGRKRLVLASGASIEVPERDILGGDASDGHLRFKSIARGPGEGQATVTLVSGATVALPEADLLPIRSVASLSVGAETRVVFGSGPSVPVPDGDLVRGTASTVLSVESAQVGMTFDIASKCARDWPTDFAVRVFCERQQREALEKLEVRPMTTPDQGTIRSKCATDWPEDYAVRNFCEEQQLNALQQLGR